MDANTSMICEQDPAVRQKVRENLKTFGFSVVEPTASKEALKIHNFSDF